MSWGERSCQSPCRCPDLCNIDTCNVDCPEYIWDKETKPDSHPNILGLSVIDKRPEVKKYNPPKHSMSKYFRRNMKKE